MKNVIIATLIAVLFACSSIKPNKPDAQNIPPIVQPDEPDRSGWSDPNINPEDFYLHDEWDRLEKKLWL